MDDLPTNEPAAKIFSGSSTEPAAAPLEYEETPVIEPIVEAHPSPSPAPESYTPSPSYAAPEKPKTPYTYPSHQGPSPMGKIGTILLFIVLFGVGMWLSMYLRNFLPSGLSNNVPSPTPAPKIATTPAANLYPDWNTYQVLNGTTKQPLGELSFKLPQDVLSPICDGPTCASQGTYLPGGTRFTVAARGNGQILADYRGAVVTDVGGHEFMTTTASVAGHPALEFNGVFNGTTVGGYAFSRMRGVMIAVTDTLAVEINHFIPSGVNADFESDDTLFNKILGSIEFTVAAPTEVPTVTLAPTATPVLTTTETTIPSPTQ